MADEAPVVTPVRITINGALAFMPGDEVPIGTARKLGLTRGKPPTKTIHARADETGVIATGSAAEVATADTGTTG